MKKFLLFSTILFVGLISAKAQIVESALITDAIFVSVSIDAAGNKYYSGSFDGTVDFDPGAGVSNLTGSDDGLDIFILKLNSTGAFQWVRHIEPQPSGTSQLSTFQEMDLIAHSSGVLMVANTLRPYDLDPSAGTFITTNLQSSLSLVSLNVSGTFQFARNIESSTTNKSVFVSAIERKSNRDIVIVGGFGGTVDFDPGAGVQNETASAAVADPYLLTLDENGDFVSVASFPGGIGNFSDVVLDSDDHVWVTGYQRGDMTVNGKNFPVIGSTSNFVIQFDASNSALSGNNWGANGLGSFLTIDPSNQDVYVASKFSIVTDFDPGAGTTTLTPVSQDFAISRFNSSGSFQSVTQVGTSGFDTPADIEMDSQSQLHVLSQKPFSSFFKLLYQVYDSNGVLLREEEPAFTNKIYDLDIENFKMEWLANFTSTNNFDFCGGSFSITDPSGGAYDPIRATYTIEEYADTPTVGASSVLICGSGSSTLSVNSGNLKDATNWEWYSGSCDGTPVGSGTSVMVSPSVTTTYYVRGEGYSCNNPGECASITVVVTDAPTDISLSNSFANENQSAGSAIGTFSSTDVTAGDTHSYSFASGTGDTDNASFDLVGDGLLTAEIFDFEVKDTYSIRIESEDALGCTYQKAFTINIGDVTPETPTDILLNSISINENNSINLTVGTFSTTDDDTSETYTYTLASGTGDSDNGSFNISGSDLRASESFDFETKNSYSIRIQTDDGNGGLYEKQFTISVNNLIEIGNDILTFSIPGQVGSSSIDNINHTVVLDMGFGTDKSNLTPTISISSGAMISPLSGASQNFSSDVNYTVTAEDATMQVWTVTVVNSLPAGTYQIGAGLDFVNLNTGISYLNNNGISGNVIFEITVSQASSTYSLHRYPGSTDHSFTIRPSSGASALTISATNNLFRIFGIENLTIDGMGLITMPRIFVEQEFGGTAPSDNITIKNCFIEALSGDIVLRAGNNILIEGNTLTGSAVSSALGHNSGILIDDPNMSNVTVRNNIIRFSTEFNGTGPSSLTGISSSDRVSGYFRIYNNTISLTPTNTNASRGILCSADELEISHNTILIDGGDGTTNIVQGILLSGAASNILNVRNNIVEVNSTVSGTGTKLALSYANTGLTSTDISDNNLTFTPDATNNDGFIKAGTTVYDLDDLETIASLFPGTTTSEVFFVDEANGDLKLSGASLTDAALRGSPISLVTTDFDGIARSLFAPSKGAFETPNNVTDILSMTFAEISGSATVDDVNHSVNAAATLGTDLSALAPSFSLLTGASISPNSGTTRDFTNIVSYTVTAEDATTQMWDVTIVEANGPPTDIQLTSTTVDEKSAPGTVVGLFSSTDPNPSDSHTYSLVSGTGDTDNSAFSVFGTNIRTAFAFDFETKPSYSVRVQSDDQNGGTFEEQFTITVNDVNDAPTDVNLSVSNVDENQPSGTVVGTLTSVDQDASDSHTYSLKIGTPDNAFFDISNDQLLTNAVFDFETKATYNLEIIADDGNGGTFEQEIAVTINDETSLITGISLSTNTLDENSLAGVTIGTFTPQGTDLGGSYTYSFVSGSGDAGNGSFNISGNDLESLAALNHEVSPSITARVQALGIGGPFEQTLTININDLPETPTDIDLSNSTINESLTIGTAIGALTTTDQDAGETYSYTLVAGTGDLDNGSFSIVGSELRSAEVFDFETKTTYTVRIQTNDGNGGLYSEAFTISIGDVPPSITDIGLTDTSVDENLPASTVVGTLSTIGEEVTGTYTYSLVSGTGDGENSSFFVDGLELKTAGVLNFEALPSASIRMRTDDGMGSTFDKVIVISVNNVNEDPTNISVSSAFIDENEPVGTSVGTITSTDADAVFSHTYSLVSGTGDIDNASFNISGDQLQSAVVFNVENQPVFKIRVRADDGLGGTLEEEWTINVNDVAEAPTDLEISASAIDENNAINDVIGSFTTTDEDAGETYTYTLVAGSGDTDNGSFNILGSQLRASSIFDFETKNSYSVRLQTDDGNGGQFEKQFTLSVNDVNETPTDIQLSNASVDESTSSGSLVGTLSTTDEDAGQSHTYSLIVGTGSTDNGSFTISGNQLQSAEVFDFETKASYSVRVQTDDGNGETFEEAFTITINDLPASVTSLDLSNLTIGENQPSGSTIGSFTTSGEDLSGSFTYSLVSGAGDTDNSSFSISGDQLVTNASFNFEVKASYSVRVMTDDGSLSDEQAFTITVNNISEAPTDLSLSTATIAENNSMGDVIGTLSTTDQDAGDSYTYTLVSGTGDTDNASFSVVGDVLQAAATFDFETQDSFSVRIQTTDGNGGVFSKAFTITIINVNESITVSSAIADQTLEAGFSTLDISLGSVFTDTDGEVLTYTATSSDNSIVTVSVSGSTLTLSEEGTGSATITVSADDGSGVATADEFLVTIESTPLGLDDEVQIDVYPNPVSDFINVVSDQSLSIRVVDIKGQKVLNQMSGQNVTIDVRRFSQGTYLLMIRGAGVNTTRKFIKTN
ncbi:MAG: cadherin domain-containing protein [Cyclobacteriaceae bacterium]